MRRDKRQYIRKEDLADLYSSLAFFTRMYDNAEAEIQTVMAEIERVYHEEYPDEPMNTDYLHNRRGAGRKSKLSPDDRKEILSLRKQGIPVDQIAERFNLEVSYVYKIIRKEQGR